MELRWHHRVAEGQLRVPCVASKFEVPEERLLGVRAFVRNVVRNAKDVPIPYGVDFTHDAFDPQTGRWLHGPTGRGLTCATFVVAVLSAAGFPFVNVATWSARPDDQQWVEKICNLLIEHAAPEQAEHIRANEAGVRLRPAEVAGAAREPASARPVAFAKAVERSAEVQTEWVNAASPT